MFTATDCRTEAKSYENVDLPLLCLLMKKTSLFDNFVHDNNAHIPETVEAFNKMIPFENPPCGVCEINCYETYEGSINILMTQNMVSRLGFGSMESWLNYLIFTCQENFQFSRYGIKYDGIRFKHNLIRN